MDTLITLLRKETGHLHRQIEGLSLSRQTIDESISVDTYRAQLVQLAAIHGCVEAMLFSFTRASSPFRFRPELARTHTIHDDLWRLSPECQVDLTPIPPTLRLVEELVVVELEQPAAALGMFYVLEGSRLGSTVICKHLAKAFHLPLSAGVGLDYHLFRKDHLADDFRQLLLDLALVDSAEHDDVILGAIALFSGLLDIYSQIPLDSPSSMQEQQVACVG